MFDDFKEYRFYNMSWQLLWECLLKVAIIEYWYWYWYFQYFQNAKKVLKYWVFLDFFNSIGIEYWILLDEYWFIPCNYPISLFTDNKIHKESEKKRTKLRYQVLFKGFVLIVSIIFSVLSSSRSSLCWLSSF